MNTLSIRLSSNLSKGVKRLTIKSICGKLMIKKCKKAKQLRKLSK